MGERHVSGFVVGASTRRAFRFFFLLVVLPVLAASDPAATKQEYVAPSPGSVNFGSVTVGTTATQTITLTNAGRGNVTIASMGTSGPGFSASGPALPFTLVPGASIVFQASFSPGNAGSATGSVYWSGNNGSVLATVPLAGDAIEPAHSATLNWAASTTTTVIGYYVYRGTTSGGPYSRITASLVPATSFTDSTVQAGAIYYYVVTAVDANNNESVYSTEIEAVIPSP